MNKIKIAIIGMGNCSSSLLQGLEYYKNKSEEDAVGLMHYDIGGYKPSDIEIVAAWDIDKRKVGKDVSEAIFQPPNCTKIFCKDIPKTGVKVRMGRILDGFSPHMTTYKDDYTFVLSEEKEPSKEDIVNILKESKAEIVVNYLPVGSEVATKFYAECALDAKVSLINNIPVFVASDPTWANKFKEKGIPIIGDDIKSQIGATETHRILTQMIIDRGGKIDSTYQVNIGGNTDFRNMMDTNRIRSKRISKTESISSQIPYDAYVYAGPNGCIDSLNDNKICHLRIDFKIFGGIPCSMDLKLSVEDSPDSAGVVIDAIRITKLAIDKGIGGALEAPSAYFMKHPIKQMREEDARKQLDNFINQN